MSSDWVDSLERYSISYPFGNSLKAIEINEDDIDDKLLSECIEQYIVSEVSKGYYITHENIKRHLEAIKEHGIEAYLEKRLELVDDE